MNKCQELIIKALENHRSDDYARAKLAFRNFNEHQMQEMHGQSGQTRQQVLDGYAAQEQAVNEAIEWVKNQ